MKSLSPPEAQNAPRTLRMRKCVFLCLALILGPATWSLDAIAAIATPAIHLQNGPHLFLDDLLIASRSNVVRSPVKLVREAISETPLITAAMHHPFQPYFTIVRERERGVFRLWYGVPTADLNHNRSRLAYMESPDGIHWTNSPQILEVGPIQFGTSVIDRGPSFPDPQHRYQLGWYMDDGLRIATSSDGLQWRSLTNGAVIKHNHDINGIFYDSLRQRYTAIVSFYLQGETWNGQRRITKQSVSTNVLDWTEPQPVLTPDHRDEGETQFYAMDGFLQRGELIVGMVKVLRDDLKADNPPQPPEAYGIGYTTLAWTRNGQTWSRERTPFLDRHPRQGAWDHAHAWIDEQLLVGDELYLYYAGYKSGHKVNRFEERQIGLLRAKRDRYVAYKCAGEGWLQTHPLLLSQRRLIVNTDASGGELLVRVLTPDGTQKSVSAPVRENSVKSAITWQQAFDDKQPVVLEFKLRNAELFGLELE